jgi:flagellar basal-body rod modification protein FlgD
MSTLPINLTAPAVSNPALTANATANLADQNIFLQLLVAQLKYQDPSSPADGTTFVTQLAQFSELSNTTQSTSDLDNINALLTANAAAVAAQNAATAGASTNGTTQAGAPPSKTT